MKFRNSFVSNSSSCSFIVEIVDDVDEPYCPRCGAKNPNSIFSEIEEKSHAERDRGPIKIQSKKDLINTFEPEDIDDLDKIKNILETRDLNNLYFLEIDTRSDLNDILHDERIKHIIEID